MENFKNHSLALEEFLVSHGILLALIVVFDLLAIIGGQISHLSS